MTPQHARPPSARLGAWFWFGAVLAVAGAAVLAAGLVVPTAPLVPAALARPVQDAPRPAVLAVAGALGLASLVAGLALARPRRRAAAGEAPPALETILLPARRGRGATLVRAPAVAGAG